MCLLSLLSSCLTCGSSHICAILAHFSHLGNTNHLRNKGVKLSILQHFVKLKHFYETWMIFSEFILPWCSSFLSKHFSCLCCRLFLSLPLSNSKCVRGLSAVDPSLCWFPGGTCPLSWLTLPGISVWTGWETLDRLCLSSEVLVLNLQTSKGQSL